jgi:hypothetical protein
MALAKAAATLAVAAATDDALRLQLHTGAPGAAGTSNVFGDATKQVVAWNAAANGARTASNAPEWTSVTAAGTVTHVSLWTTGGVYRGSAALVTSKTLAIGDGIKFTALTASITNDG